MSELLTEGEAAVLAKVCERTIRRLIDKGLLPAVNYGMGRKKIYRIIREDLDKVQPVQPPPKKESQRRGRPMKYEEGDAWPPKKAA